MKKEGLLRVLLVPCDTTQLGTSVLPRYLVVLYHKVLVELAIVLCPKSENKDHFDILKYVCFSSCGTRSSSSFKLKHMSSKCNRQLHSYFFRLPRIWNSLPPIDPYTVSFSTIKSRITSHLIDHFLDNFDSDNPCTYHYTCPCHKCSKTPVNLH